MKTTQKLFTLLLIASTFSAFGQTVKNAKTETVKINGNCGMCEKTIEAAALIKNEASADWNKDTKMAVITYDSTKTTADAVLKRIAYAGYDNPNYLAPKEAYNKLPGCCQYARTEKKVAKTEEHHEKTEESPAKTEASTAKTEEHHEKSETTIIQDNSKPKAIDPFAPVFDSYFGIKDALIKDDGATASAKARELFKAIDAVDMAALSQDVHSTWMKYMTKLSYDAEHIKGTSEVEHQREHFAALSKNMYELIKVVKPTYSVFYDHCPMYNKGKGAYWLSKQSGIKNPYYGSKMLSCGKTIETLK